MSRRPLIGIPTYVERARWGVWESSTCLLPLEYAQAVQRGGGIALLLAPDEALEDDPSQLISLLDGLILAGGVDVDPARYGAERHPKTDKACPERDRFEIALARAAVEAELPLLGICRGMQVLNVALGGTLVQDLPDAHGHNEHRRVLGSFDGADHPVQLEAGSQAAGLAGEIEHRTLSHHHQGIDKLGVGLRVTGTSTLDPVPEAVEMPGDRLVLGVQWHPEADPDSPVIAEFVRRAASTPL